MIYVSYNLEQWIETFDKYGRPTQAYEKIDDIEACINTNKVYKTIGSQVYTITEPVAIVPKVLTLDFAGKYRIVSAENIFEVASFQLSSRFTVLNIKEVAHE
ncbi:MAG: hypothetical protein AB9856_20860 [Cellulosilyticaceae bacterium]